VLQQRGAVAPSQAAAVSAGSAIACLALTGRCERGLAYFKDLTARNRRNVYPERLLSGGLFPHERMYREAIIALMERPALAELARGPELRIVVARPPAWLGHRRAALAGFAAYSAELRLRRHVHPRLPRRLGFAPEVVRVQDCRTSEELADLILQSSCTPPFTPLLFRTGRPVLDGGLVDPAPTFAIDPPRRILVLLSKRYRALPARADAVYVQPSAAVPIYKWDYTNPVGLQAAFELGCRDGERFVARRDDWGAVAEARP
jgi:hypothetical protein